MRIAFLADIHGNLAAFEAVLEHIAQQHIDQVVIAGDIVVGSPDSAACWRLAQSLNCPIVRGNHERYVALFDTPEAPTIWQTAQFAPVRWAFNQLSTAERQALKHLPLSLHLPEYDDLLIVHASLRGDHDSVTIYTPEDQLDAMFPHVHERMIVRAHNHAGQIRLWGEHSIVTIGSVGLPLDCNPTAQYLILERHARSWHIQHQSVAYDLATTLRRFAETNYLASTGPIGWLMHREVATASFHVVPFLRAYATWSEQEDISLEAAFTRFLSGTLG